MSEYIFNVPDSNQPIAGDSAVYYPDERDDPMIVREEIVRCRDCKFGVDGGKYCAEGCADSWDWRNVEPDGFCAWAVTRGTESP